MDSKKLRRTVILVTRLLVEGRYQELESLSGGRWVAVTDLEKAIEDYGRHLVMPPITSFEKLNVIEIKGSAPAQWYVGVDLWTAEEGQSDLTLELTLTDIPGDIYQVDLDDLHVL